MRAVIQRVARASVSIAGAEHAAIGPGLLVLLGVEQGDTETDVAWLSGKIARLRVFPDDLGRMNRSVSEAGGALLVVSQFTLLASTARGNRPSFTRSAPPEAAVPLYQALVRQLSAEAGRPVATGEFGAAMEVALVNAGPVTLVIDSRQRE